MDTPKILVLLMFATAMMSWMLPELCLSCGVVWLAIVTGGQPMFSVHEAPTAQQFALWHPSWARGQELNF